ISASRPLSVVTSATTVLTPPAATAAISAAAAPRSSAPRAVNQTFTPSLARARAQALPKPLLEPQTMADRPAIPKSIVLLPQGGLTARSLQLYRKGKYTRANS